MKEITKYWKQTCIEFGKYLILEMGGGDVSHTGEIEHHWHNYQEKMAKGINDVLDEVTPNDKINCYCGHTTICDCQPLNAIEKAENDFIKSKIEEAEEEGFDDDLEFGSKQIIINHDMFKIVEQLQSQVKALNTMVSANNIALNNVEKAVDQYNGKTRTGGLTPDTGPRN